MGPNRLEIVKNKKIVKVVYFIVFFPGSFRIHFRVFDVVATDQCNLASLGLFQVSALSI